MSPEKVFIWEEMDNGIPTNIAHPHKMTSRNMARLPTETLGIFWLQTHRTFTFHSRFCQFGELGPSRNYTSDQPIRILGREVKTEKSCPLYNTECTSLEQYSSRCRDPGLQLSLAWLVGCTGLSVSRLLHLYETHREEVASSEAPLPQTPAHPHSLWAPLCWEETPSWLFLPVSQCPQENGFIFCRARVLKATWHVFILTVVQKPHNKMCSHHHV